MKSFHDQVDMERLVRSRATVLGVWAHPDDEAYMSAALMARVVAHGGRVTVLTATRGELGSDDPSRAPELGRVREQELRTAMRALGVHDVRIIGLADGSLAAERTGDLAAPIAEVMRELEPDLVLTFGPDGITGHPDHFAISAATTLAWASSGHGRLLYATMTEQFADDHADLHDQIGLSMVGGLSPVDDDELALRIIPTLAERRQKRAALAAHHSQIQGLVDLLGEAQFHDWWVDEMFREPTSNELTAAVLGAAGMLVTG